MEPLESYNRWGSGGDGTTLYFRYELLDSTEAVRERIQQCEGQHVQQAIFSTFMDTLTQVCFTEQVIRSTIAWEGNRSWRATPEVRERSS